MTKKDIAKKIAEAVDLPQLSVSEIVQMLFDGITEILVEEGRIELRNFGVFEVKTRKPRKARNPRTGETVMVPARKSVTFKAGREMLTRVAELGVAKPAPTPDKSGSMEASERAGLAGPHARQTPS